MEHPVPAPAGHRSQAAWAGSPAQRTTRPVAGPPARSPAGDIAIGNGSF